MSFYWTYQGQGGWALWSIKTLTNHTTEYSGFLGRVYGSFRDDGFVGYAGGIETRMGHKHIEIAQSLTEAKLRVEALARKECEFEL